MNKSIASSVSMVSLLLLSVLLTTASISRASTDKPPIVGGGAKDFELKELGKDSVKFSKFTTNGPVVLVVLRGYPGYQCPYCTKQVADFLAKADDFKKAGVQVVFIYPGPSDDLEKHADEFVKGKSFPDHFHLLVDPDYAFTNAYGLRWDAKKETAYPSTFVTDSKSKVIFAKVSKTHSDRTKAADVLKVLQEKA
jgi:thioredoxin-dependent peroxiredoxin